VDSPSPVAAASERFRHVLQRELAARCARNPRYSLRSFAARLRVDHSTLSQILRGRRRLTPRAIGALGRRLGLSPQSIKTFVEREQAARSTDRAMAHAVDGALRDAAAVVDDPLHTAVLELARLADFQADVRWMARVLDATPDRIAAVIDRLVRLNLLIMEAPGRWAAVPPASITLEALTRRALRHFSAPGAGGAAASTTDLAPARIAEGRAQMGSPVVEWQILAKDPDKTAAFYTRLFGWRVDANNPLNYRRVLTNAGRGIDGGIWPSPPQGHAFVQLFVEVDDVSAYVKRGQDLGARVIIPPQQLPGGDEMAVMADTEGLPFALVRRGSRAL